MSYTPPYIDNTGIHINTYTDIRDYLLDTYKSIYGSDVYLENDAADYQWISAMALAINDEEQSVQASYNNRSPKNAVGIGLDAVVKINGIKRQSASRSTCTVTLTGTAGTTIYNGKVTDNSGNKWDLPSIVTIEGGGTVDVTAVCETEGAITATAGTITGIATPTAGWISVTNAAAAIPGQPVEIDSALRTRQALSVALPSQTLLAGSAAALANLSGVTRSKVYENYTNSTDANGLVAHSMAAVVEGGDEDAIALAVWLNKNEGCNLNGTTTVNITEPTFGQSVAVKFYRPTYVPIFVTVTLTSWGGYTSAMGDSIKQAIVDYLNSLDIGADVSRFALAAKAESINPDLKNPAFSVTNLALGKTTPGSGTSDITIAFNEVAQGVLADITITVV